MKKLIILFIFSSFLSAQNLEYFILSNHAMQEKKNNILKKLVNYNRFLYDRKREGISFYQKGESLSSYLQNEEMQEQGIAEPKKHFEETGNFKPFNKKDFFILFRFINIGYDKWDFDGFNLGYCVSDESCFGK